MELKKKTIIWEDNNEPPKDYIWAKKDGKFYEYSHSQRGWIESNLISTGNNEENSESGSDDTLTQYCLPYPSKIVGYIDNTNYDKFNISWSVGADTLTITDFDGQMIAPEDLADYLKDFEDGGSNYRIIHPVFEYSDHYFDSTDTDWYIYSDIWYFFVYVALYNGKYQFNITAGRNVACGVWEDSNGKKYVIGFDAGD